MNEVCVPDWPGFHCDQLQVALDQLAWRLSELDGPCDEAGAWPEVLWDELTAIGATSWAVPQKHGGQECERFALMRRYARIAEGSLTAAFILTQHDASIRRLALACDNPRADEWLQSIALGHAFTTVGLSQLSTSRRYGEAALRAKRLGSRGYQLDGIMPWVTGAERARVIVGGAVEEDGNQILFALPANAQGVIVATALPLAAIQASRTSEVHCSGVVLACDEVIAGPNVDVMSTPGAAGTGGLETSALALGQARAAIVALAHETQLRQEPIDSVQALSVTWAKLAAEIEATAAGTDRAQPPGEIRRQSNALVLRATQACLTARKGTGFVRPDAAQRWARQALFFLVWSCPGPVAQASIRDLAGVCSE